MARLLRWCWSVVLGGLLAACGGGGGGGGVEPGAPPPAAPPVASSGTGTLKSSAHVLEAGAAAGSTLTENTLVVRKPQPRVFAVGEVMVLDAHGGRLIRIESVLDATDTITYGYSLASLTDVFASLDVRIQGDLGPQDLGDTIASGDPDVEISWVTLPAEQKTGALLKDASVQTNALQIKYKNFAGQVGSGIEIGGTAQFRLNPDMSLNLVPSAGGGLPGVALSASVSPGLQSSVSISSLYGGQISGVLDKEVKLPAFRRVIIVPVLGVPVPVPFWIQPSVTISGSINGTAGSKFTTTYSHSVQGSVGFTRTPEGGASGSNSFSVTSNQDVSDVESEFGVQLAAPKVELKFMIYSLAGPSFDAGTEFSVVGKSAVQGTPPVEGVLATASAKFVANGGLKGGVDFKNIDAVKKLMGDLSVEYTAFSLKLYDHDLGSKQWFFPYKGEAAVVVRDNGNVPDDIFEVSLDGVVMGQTTKGGSGQFRLKNLRPGTRTLTLRTVEDDSPPGTYEITLNDGLTFEGGGTTRSGGLNLGQSTGFSVVVPAPAPAP